jgi:hypothetical protein
MDARGACCEMYITAHSKSLARVLFASEKTSFRSFSY